MGQSILGLGQARAGTRICLLGGCIVLAGCGESGARHVVTTQGPAALVAPSPYGIVTGTISPGRGLASASRYAGPGIVTVFLPGGPLVVRQRVQRGHHFRFRLPPGRYELTADGSLLRQPDKCSPRTVTVRPGDTTAAVVSTQCGIE